MSSFLCVLHVLAVFGLNAKLIFSLIIIIIIIIITIFVSCLSVATLEIVKHFWASRKQCYTKYLTFTFLRFYELPVAVDRI